MKASLQLRDDRSPLVRAKLPVTALGFPFLSAFSAGDPRDLRLDLSTAFPAGPVVRLSYRPNDARSPFSLSVKMGAGDLGSPIGAPVTMCAEFNPLARGASPCFSVVFKPRLGDFSLKKIARSRSGAPTWPVDLGSSQLENGFQDGKKVNGFAPGVAPVVGCARGLLSGTEIQASSVLPLRGHATLRFRWGVRLPAELRGALGAYPAAVGGISFRGLPQLVMSKISIRHTAEDNKAREQESDVAAAVEVAGTCPSVKQQLESLRAENGILRRDVKELCAKVLTRRKAPATSAADVGDWRSLERGSKVELNPPPESSKDRQIDRKPPATGSKSRAEDLNEELRKALMAAASAGK